MTPCFLSHCWHIFLRHFFLGSSDDCPLCFPLPAKVVQTFFYWTTEKKDRTAAIFRTVFFPFPSLLTGQSTHGNELSRYVCCQWQWTIFPCSAHFCNPMIFLLLFLGKSMKLQMLVFLWVSIAVGNLAVVGRILFFMNIWHQICHLSCYQLAVLTYTPISSLTFGIW